MTTTGPTTYVMVHSAWLGGWAWRSVAPFLEKHGHKVITPDLPGHGQDKTPPAKVTLDSYVKTVTDILDSQESTSHSLPSSWTFRAIMPMSPGERRLPWERISKSM